MKSFRHNGTAYTVRKLETGEYRAAYRDPRTGALVSVTHKLQRIAVACIKSHIEELWMNINSVLNGFRHIGRTMVGMKNLTIVTSSCF